MAVETTVGRPSCVARRRAVEGVRRSLLHKGKPIIDPKNGGPYYEVKAPDQLLMFLLEARGPAKYGDRATGSGRSSLQVNLAP